MPLAAVMLVSQAAGLVGISAIVALSGEPAPASAELAPAAAAGAAGALALSAFYRALAIGTMSIVAPVSATGAAVPVFVGLATGDELSALVAAGIAAAIVGVVLAAREEAPEGSAQAAVARRSLVLALAAALGFGAFFVGMDASADAGVLWALLAARIASFSLIAIAYAVARPPVAADAPRMALLVGIGVLDLGANASFAAATNEGLLSVAGVLGSLYPLVTVLLARLVLGERVRRVQGLGIAAALLGVVLIAAG